MQKAKVLFVLEVVDLNNYFDFDVCVSVFLSFLIKSCHIYKKIEMVCFAPASRKRPRSGHLPSKKYCSYDKSQTYEYQVSSMIPQLEK